MVKVIATILLVASALSAHASDIWPDLRVRDQKGGTISLGSNATSTTIHNQLNYPRGSYVAGKLLGYTGAVGEVAPATSVAPEFRVLESDGGPVVFGADGTSITAHRAIYYPQGAYAEGTLLGYVGPNGEIGPTTATVNTLLPTSATLHQISLNSYDDSANLYLLDHSGTVYPVKFALEDDISAPIVEINANGIGTTQYMTINNVGKPRIYFLDQLSSYNSFALGAYGTTIQLSSNSSGGSPDATTGFYSIPILSYNSDYNYLNFPSSVGIGSSTFPSNALDVTGDANVSGILKIGTIASQRMSFLSAGSFSAGIKLLQSSGVLNFYNSSGSILASLDSATGRLKVGSGSAVEALDVTGNAKVSGYGRIGGTLSVGSTATPTKTFQVTDASGAFPMRSVYDATHYTDFGTAWTGDFTIEPSGGDVGITGNLVVSNALYETGNRRVTSFKTQIASGSGLFSVDVSAGNDFRYSASGPAQPNSITDGEFDGQLFRITNTNPTGGGYINITTISGQLYVPGGTITLSAPASSSDTYDSATFMWDSANSRWNMIYRN